MGDFFNIFYLMNLICHFFHMQPQAPLHLKKKISSHEHGRKRCGAGGWGVGKDTEKADKVSLCVKSAGRYLHHTS